MRDSNADQESSDKLLRLVLDSALEHAVFLLDRDGRVTWWSNGAERVFAVAREHAIGKSIAQIFTPVDRENPQQAATPVVD
jgi:PAS domain S-box-containing protein